MHHSLPRPAPRRTLLGALLALGLTGCGGTSADPIQPCARVGQKCRKPAGGLGVCVRGVDQRTFDCASQN